jgi:paraquat-inducible protein A
MIACETCGLIQEVGEVPPQHLAQCSRCGTVLQDDSDKSRSRTAAFAIAAICLYIPANIYPIMTMDYMGRSTENTVWGGVRALYQDDMVAVAILVFAASILIPLLKLLGLFFLVTDHGNRWQRTRTWIYRIVSKIGPWAMLDVFLLSVIVALIRFGKLANVTPGPGIFAFAAVVVFTLLASASFDPRLIWKEGALESNNEK